MVKSTRFHQGQLTVSQVMSDAVATVPLGTPLLQVASLLTKNSYKHVLVSDPQGSVVGVVSSSDLIRHMSEWTDDNADGWRSKGVESVMMTRFVASTPDADVDDVAQIIAKNSIQCVPVMEGEKLVGVLTSDDLLLSCNRLDPVLKQAATDALTGLSNRGTFDRRLTEEWDRASRQGSPLGLMMIDVDFFKQINDTCGHTTGDAILCMIGACLGRQLRSYDVVARYAGDEFSAICCGCEPEDIDIPIQRLQRAVRNLSVPSQFGRRGITLSIGAAVIRGEYGGLTDQDLVNAADACLYRAKKEGRSRAFRAELTPQGITEAIQVDGEGVVLADAAEAE